MPKRLFLILCLFILTMSLAAGLVLALSETEPNNSPAQADPLDNMEVAYGAIDPTGDQDYYIIPGVNPSWGIIALLQTDSSSASQEGALAFIGSDGSTVLQADSGSWAHGSGIAMQSYDGGNSHYLRVNESGDDAPVTTYTLRYYETVVSTQPEVEPNGTRGSATPSAFTHAGVLDPASDRDCYAFEGAVGDTILLALNGDPEEDGSVADPILELIGPNDTLLDSADHTGVGGKEFLEYGPLAEHGVYAYCVTNAALAGGPAATYEVGIVRNGILAIPRYEQGPTWLDRPADGMAEIGDTLTFRLAFTNTGLVTIPDDINLIAGYDNNCLSFVRASIMPTGSSPGSLLWYGLRPSGLAPGEAFVVEVEMEALAQCGGDLYQGTVIDYYVTGTAGYAHYSIGAPYYLTALFRP